ncbi:MAG: single stranded DNA-binding protein [Bacteroidetes bacterium]|nr:MAG: single stranded DNA-binding protein [Bacteroidota bacterium]
MNNLNNTVQLIGRLGNDPEIRSFEPNRKFARLRIATSDEYTNKGGEKVKQTQWHNLVVWGGLADVCENHLSKGQEIAIEGKLGYRVYTDKEGNKHFITEITVNELLMVGGPRVSRKE